MSQRQESDPGWGGDGGWGDEPDPNAVAPLKLPGDPTTGPTITTQPVGPRDVLTDPSAAPALPAAPGGPDPAAAPQSGRDRAAAYFKSKGVTPFATSLDSWDGYWNAWGSKDPAYFDKRLSEADEFTGVGPNYDWQRAGKADPGNKAGGGFWNGGAGPVAGNDPAANVRMLLTQMLQGGK